MARLKPRHLLMIMLLVGCEEGAPPSDAGPACPRGTKSYKTACVPVFDTCKDDEVPQPGGGCKRVGVKECTVAATGQVGIQGPPSWTCKPIGPPLPCRAGWTKVTGGWCEPLLPAAKCSGGTMAVLGHSTCQPVRDCGSGTWGKVQTTSTTIFVDAGYKGGASDGSQGKPYTRIGDALKNAGSAPHLALAEGTYAEDVRLTTDGVVLDGRCPRLVTLKGQGINSNPAVLVSGKGVTVRGVTITGPRGGVFVGPLATGTVIEQLAVRSSGEEGLLVGASASIRDVVVDRSKGVGVRVYARSGSQKLDVVLERVAVEDTIAGITSDRSGQGITISGSSSVRIKDSLVSGNVAYGIQTEGAAVTLDRTVVTGTRENFQGRPPNGAGVGILEASTGSQPAGAQGRGTLRDCVLKDNTTTGVEINGASTVLVERTVVSGTKSSAFSGRNGNGFVTQPTLSSMSRPSLVIRDSLVVSNIDSGILLLGTDATIERTVVRDTRPLQVPSQGHGHGVGVWAEQDYSMKTYLETTLTMRDSLVAGNTTAGIQIPRTRATLERIVVRDTKLGAHPNGKLSYGIRAPIKQAAREPVKTTYLTLRDSLVSGNKSFGLMLVDGRGVLERSIIQDNTSDDAQTGAGLYVGTATKETPSSVMMTDMLLARNQVIGIFIIHSAATLERIRVRDTRVDVDGNFGLGVAIYFYFGQGYPAASANLSDSIISGNRTAGVEVWGPVPLTIRRSVFAATAADKEGYGDAVMAESNVSLGSPTITVEDSLLDGSARAGLLLRGGAGSVRRSLLRGNTIGVALDLGANPTLAEDNVFEGNKEKIARSRNLLVSPMPKLPPAF